MTPAVYRYISNGTDDNMKPCDVYSRDSCRCRTRKASLPINSMPRWSDVSGSSEGKEKETERGKKVIKNSVC